MTVEKVKNSKNDFPCLNQEINGHALCYLDNAATTLKPQHVIDKITHYYTSLSSNVHRGIHKLSQDSTIAYEKTRMLVKDFINARAEEEIIFTSGTTASINTVAYSYGDFIREGDEIIVSEMEHHSDIVPWQMLCERKGASIKVLPMNDKGELNLEKLKEIVNEKTKLVAVVYISNSLGTINPVKEIIEIIRNQSNAKILIDGAQVVAHKKIDVQKLDCDFFTFSAHKLFGPTGFGILYGKKEILDAMPPFFGGGDMIDKVSFEGTTYNSLPNKFEAGTPHIAGSIGLGAAIEYINELGIENIATHENELTEYGLARLNEIEGLRILGQAKDRTTVFSFVIDGIHGQDLGMVLDQSAIAVRIGHHCTQPVMEHFKVDSTVRASLSFYNTKQDIDRLVEAIKKAQEFFL